MKIPDFKIEIPLRTIADTLFGDKEPVPIEQTFDAPELADANEELRQMNRDIRDRDGRDIKKWSDVL